VHAQPVVECRHDPVIAFEHLPGAGRVVAFVDVPETGSTQVGQAQSGGNDEQQEVVTCPAVKKAEHSFVPRAGNPPRNPRQPDYKQVVEFRQTGPKRKRVSNFSSFPGRGRTVKKLPLGRPLPSSASSWEPCNRVVALHGPDLAFHGAFSSNARWPGCDGRQGIHTHPADSGRLEASSGCHSKNS